MSFNSRNFWTKFLTYTKKKIIWKSKRQKKPKRSRQTFRNHF